MPEDNVKLTIPNGILTRRLYIRPHNEGDVDGFVEFMTDDVATRFLNFDPGQRTAKGARELLGFIIASYETETPVFALAITERSNKTYMGSCGLSPLADEKNAVECYFSLLPSYWGWGYATESIEALLYYAFVELEINRVVANIPDGNQSAFSVAESAGMKDAGTVEFPNRDQAVRFAITKTEYFALTERMHPGEGDGDERKI